MGAIISFMENSANNIDNIEQMRLDFISTVSHELRTPLTSIRGFADTLINSYGQLSKEQQLKFLNIIKDQSNRLINLVENLLAASAQSFGEEIYVFKAVKVSSVIDKTLNLIKQKYPRKNIILKFCENPSEILADPEKLEQILLNIIENACKYSFENSDIEIKVNHYGLEKVLIEVANEGITIEDSDKAKIFQKFSRLDNPMTRLTQGSGMGLFIASHMTEKMNGEIKVQSENEHTIFLLIFPAATAENVAKIKMSDDEIRGGKDD